MDDPTHTHNPPARLRVSIAQHRADVVDLNVPVSPLQCTTEPDRHGEDGADSHTHALSNLTGCNRIILIDPKKINDFWRFRAIFYGMLLMINTSTQGLFSIFGLYMQARHGYDVRTMVDIITVGTTVGLFVFPFGVLSEYIGPRIVIAAATVITALSHLLFALTFGGHIAASKARYCIYFALMNWGCYAFDVVALPTVLGFTPRNRAQPVGLMNTFTGLGPSVFTTLFRAFFNNRYDHLMYFLMATVIGFGVVGTLFLDNAPYVITRFEENRISLKERLRRQLIRNRFMSQLLPKRRLQIVAFILVVLNLYLTIQSIVVAYTIDTMTKTRYVGIAVGVIIIVSCLLTLVVPLHCLDNPTALDHLVLEKAREKEHELMQRRIKCNLKESEEKASATKEDRHELDDADVDTEKVGDTAAQPNGPQALSAVEVAGEDTPTTELEFRPVDPNVDLIEAYDVRSVEVNGEGDTVNALQQWLCNETVMRGTAASDAPTTRGGHVLDSVDLEVVPREVSTYDHPCVETITVCSEVFVTPLYETTFLQSLTYMDLWLLFYTTFVLWGIGLTLTLSWNIRIMLGSRVDNLDAKIATLYATISGVSTAFGRVAVGGYEMMLPFLGKRVGVSLPATIGYPVPSILMVVALIFYLSFPGNYSLLVVYMVGPAAYGFSTSMTIYIIGVIFKRDIGMHYGFCFLGAALGFAVLYRALLFRVYDKHKIIFPPGFPVAMQGVCRGNVCMQTTLIVYLVLSLTSVATSYLLHYRYWKLVRGKLKYRRVIPRLVQMGRRLGHSEGNEAPQQDNEEEEMSRRENM